MTGSGSPLRAELTCASGCDVHLPLSTTEFQCPKCSGLLAVTHDVAALKETSGAAWRERFAARRHSIAPIDASGVWSKREWVHPLVSEADIVTVGEGATPLTHAKRLGQAWGVPSLFVKQCGTSHTGSFKDLGMTVLVSNVVHAVRTGALASPVVACASTGDTSAALAAYGAAAGLPVVVLLPKGLVSTAQLLQPLAHGAHVLALETDFDGCMVIVRELARRGLVYLANSMNAIRIEGQKTVAFEIAEQLGWEVPDWVVLPGGNLGNSAALHVGFSLMRELGVTDRMPRLCVAQAANADPLYRAFVAGKETVDAVAAKRTAASAIQIGRPVSAPRAMAALRAMNGVVEEATEDELADAAAFADRTGLYACPHTAVALAALQKLLAKGTVRGTERVVVVSTASALKFTEFKLGYHEGRLPEAEARRRNEPVTLPPNADAVAKVVAGLAHRQ
ncbi:MAG: threonine synthase [Polyangiaceae bacterium]